MKKCFFALAALIIAAALSACSPGAAENRVHSAEDLEGKKIGVIAGSESAVSAAEIADASVVQYQSVKVLAEAVKQNEVDCAVVSPGDAEKMTKSSGLKTLDEAYIDAEYGIIAALENADLTADVNSALAKLRTTGRLAKIVASSISDADYVYEQTVTKEEARASLTLAVDTGSPPFSYMEADGTFGGIDVFVARAVCDELGIWLEVQNVKSEKIIPAIQGGWADLGMGRFFAAQGLEDIVNISSGYMRAEQVIVVRK